jgi:hypothetical protein
MPENLKISEGIDKNSLDLVQWRREIQFINDMDKMKEFKLPPYPGSINGP